MTTIPQVTATTTDISASSAAPLYFDLNTSPDPVRVSPSSGDPERADFVLVASRRSPSAIECRKITIYVPTGTNSADLTSDLTSAAAQISLPDWTPTTLEALKKITFTPTSGHAVIGRDEGVTLQLMGMIINAEVGTSVLRIDVEWRDAGFDDEWATATTEFDVGKFPATFHLGNFIAEKLIIDNGGSVKLNWEASGVSSLRLLYDVADINVMNRTTYTVDNIGHTTVFYLRATLQVGNNTVERILSVTVTVRIPDLYVKNLTVSGTFSALGGITKHLTPEISTPNLGADPEHPLEKMLDWNLHTYYLSQSASGQVDMDFGATQTIDAIDVYFGRPDGSDLPDGFLDMPKRFYVNYSVDGKNWTQVIAGSDAQPAQPERHWSGAGVTMRYIQLTLADGADSRVAVRSFQVGPAAVRITSDLAYFDIPVTARKGITEG